MSKNTGKKFLSDLKLYSDYLKWKPELNRYETWEEACEDIIEGHRKKFVGIDLEEEFASALESMKDMRVFASQRTLQFRAPQLERSNLRVYNCSVLHAVKNTVFQETFYLGLNGCGVGISLLIPFIKNLSNIQKRNKGTKTFVVPDTIEGWSDALGVLMSSYFVDNQPFPEYAGYEIKFDYSLIRPRGAFLSGGFKAPGPDGLRLSLDKIETLIENWISKNGNVMRPILVYDIICHASDAVLSGSVRRSALIMLLDPNDEEMLNAKTGNWRQDNPQRARSNNSALIHRQSGTREFFDKVVGVNDGDSDLGFIFVNSWLDLQNPCYLKDTKVLTTTGWQTFEEIMEKQNSQEDVFILQDARVSSYVDDNKNEIWVVDKSKNGLICNKIGKVGLTRKNAEIVEVETTCGRSIKCTKNHKFFTFSGETKNAEDLIPGKDKLLITESCLFTPDSHSIDFKLGLISGLIFGDGFNMQEDKSKNEAGISLWFKEDNECNDKIIQQIEDICEEVMTYAIHNKHIFSDGHKPLTKNLLFRLQTQVGNSIKYTLSSAGLMKLMKYLGFFNKSNVDFLFDKSKNFHSGFVNGMIFTDGSVEYGLKSQTISVRISQSNKKVLQDISLILQDLGYIARLYKMMDAGMRYLPDSNREKKQYNCKASYRLIINGFIQCSNVLKNLFTIHDYKKEKLINCLSLSQKEKQPCRWSLVKSITNMPNEDVYCLEENVNRTLIANGISSTRCAEISFTPVDTQEDVTAVGYHNLETWTRNNIDSFGVQMCNLCSMNAEKMTSKELFLRSCKDAAFIGTLQAAYTDFPYLSKASENITKKEALLGVSMTGWMNNPKMFDAELLKTGSEIVKETNKKIASKIGVNPAARTTCVKPEGNLSVIAQTSSGIHPEHSERYFRIMQLNKGSDTAKWLEVNMPFLLEESVWSASKTDYVVFIPVTNPKGGLFKEDMKGLKHLELIRLVQENWVMGGTNKHLGISDNINHNVSATVIIDDRKQICDYIWNNKEIFTGVSFISDYGDKDFNQAPFTSVLTHEEIMEKYGRASLFASGLIVDGLHYFNQNLWQACDCVKDKTISVGGTREEALLRKSWIDRAKKFARNYFKGDLTQMVYCIKEIHLLHKWDVISRNIKEVDFSKILTKPEYKDVSSYAAIACSGGTCEITRI